MKSMIMKERVLEDRRKLDARKNGSAVGCVQQAAEWLGMYSRILKDLRRDTSMN